MTQSSVTTEIHKTLDAHLYVATKVPFHAVIRLQHLADGLDVIVGEVIGANRMTDAGLVQHFFSDSRPDTIDVGQTDEDPLVTRKVDSSNTGHAGLSLPLFVFGDFANDSQNAAAANHLALFTDLFDGCSNFHGGPYLRVLKLSFPFASDEVLLKRLGLRDVDDDGAVGIAGAFLEANALPRPYGETETLVLGGKRSDDHFGILSFRLEAE